MPHGLIRKLLGFLAPVLGLSLLFGLAPRAPATTVDVDLQLVLAVDSSGSIDDDEFILQRWGYAHAFRNPRIIRAIRNGYHRAIAVTYIEWSGPGIQVTIAEWTVIKDAETANRFADRLEAVPRAMISGHGTALGEAILMAAQHFDHNKFKSPRLVIDVSGDGPTTAGRPASWARDLVAARGITINGLPVIDERYPDLHLFFLDHVIGGPGAFSIPAYGFKDFAAAVLNKLIREIAEAAPCSVGAMAGGRKAAAAGGTRRAHCLAGRRLSSRESGERRAGRRTTPIPYTASGPRPGAPITLCAKPWRAMAACGEEARRVDSNGSVR